MHQRNTQPSSSTTCLSSSSTRSNNTQQTDTLAARLVTYCSKSSSINSNTVDHYYVPHPPLESDFLFECCLAAVKIISLFSQYLLIYKSEKWLGPYFSSTDSFLHWRHIDQYVVAILIIFCLSLQDKLYFLRVFINIIALIYSYWIYSWKYILVFTYPLVCSLLINHDQNSNQQQQQVSISSDQLPQHWCSNDAFQLRQETDCLRIEFNQRIRHILFSSFLSTYYICLVPLAFCDTYYIHLDIVLLLQYDFILFLSLILLYTSHYLPLNLLTVFHRNGKHLGSWQYQPNHTNIPLIPIWDEKHVLPYESNSIVRHKRQIYRSSAHLSTVAEPGNAGHTRFAMLFHQPWLFQLILCVLQVIVLGIQLSFLIVDQRWFSLLSQMILFIFNTYTIYHTTRDMYLLYLVYFSE